MQSLRERDGGFSYGAPCWSLDWLSAVSEPVNQIPPPPTTKELCSSHERMNQSVPEIFFVVVRDVFLALLFHVVSKKWGEIYFRSRAAISSSTLVQSMHQSKVLRLMFIYYGAAIFMKGTMSQKNFKKRAFFLSSVFKISLYTQWAVYYINQLNM